MARIISPPKGGRVLARAEGVLEGTVTILFTDVQGSTELRNQRGDAAAREILRAQEDLIRQQVEAHGGREVKALGDGFMVAFASARRAVQCAVGIQRAVLGYNHEHPDAEVHVRVGLNSGEVSEEEGDLFGLAVNAASRVAAKAKGGEVLVAGVVKQLAGKVPDVDFVDRGRFRLKGFDERWQLFQLSWDDDQDQAVAVAATPHDRAPLVAREAEKAELLAALDAAIGGRSTVVLLGGEPGVGKTRLADEVLAEAERRGFRTFIGRCYEEEGTPPYQPFVEIVEMAAAKLPADILRRDLGDAAPEVARLMPELRRRFDDISEPMVLPPEQERRYLFNSIFEFIGRASGAQPVCVLLDDIHWADEASLLLFEHIAQRVAGLRLVILGTYRDVELELGRPLARTLDALLRQRLVRRMMLKRLDAGGVKAMLAALGGSAPPEALVDVIFEETEGNPFFVEEVYRHLAESGELFQEPGRWRANLIIGEVDVPESVRLVIGRRLERLDASTRAALASAAVIGRAFSFSLLGAMQPGLSEDALFEALDEAERARLLTSTAVGRDVVFTFAHELIRQTLLAELSTLKRQRLHQAVAEAIETADHGNVEVRAAEIAFHLVEAGLAADPAKLARYLAIAGERAQEATAFSDAVRFFENALEVAGAADRTDRARALAGLGAAQRSIGRWEESRAAWAEAIDIYGELGDNETVGRLSYEMALALAWSFRWEDCLLVAGRGLAAIENAPSRYRVGLLALSGLILSLAGNHDAGDSMTTEALDAAERISDPTGMAFALGVRAIHHWAYLSVMPAVDFGQRSLDLAREHGLLWSMADVGPFIGFALHMAGEDDRARELADEVLALTARIGHMQAQNLARRVRMLVTPVEEVSAWSRFAEEDLRIVADLEGDWLGDAYAYRGWGAFYRGDWDAALDFFERSVAEKVDALPWVWNSVYGGILFWSLTYRGERDQALAVLDRVRPELPVPGIPNPLGAWGLLLFVVEGLVMLGENELAYDLYPLLLEALASGATTVYGSRLVAEVAGMAAAAGGDWGPAINHFDQAIVQAEEGNWGPERAEVRRFYAQALLARGQDGDAARAAAMVREAMTIYGDAGMPRHRQLAEALLVSPR